MAEEPATLAALIEAPAQALSDTGSPQSTSGGAEAATRPCSRSRGRQPKIATAHMSTIAKKDAIAIP